MKQTLIFAAACVIFSTPSLAQCLGGDAQCWTRHNMERAQDQLDQFDRQMQASQQASLNAVESARAAATLGPSLVETILGLNQASELHEK